MHTPSPFRRLVEDARTGHLAPAVADTNPLAEIDREQHEFVSGGHVGELVLIPRP